jgi:predicted helicase
MTVHDLLDQFRANCTSTHEQGTMFERLIRCFLEQDPMYAMRFKKIWMWRDWPLKWGPDCGIDLVAEDIEGHYCAIQCKFFASEYSITKDDIDSFFTESGRKFKSSDGQKVSFSSRIIAATTDYWSLNAERSIGNQTIPVTRIGIVNLEQSPIDWGTFSSGNQTRLSLRQKKKLRPHQSEAITKVKSGFATSDRGKLIMACGTGKTFTALRLAEEIAQKSGSVLFLVPSISLLSQTLREWTAESESEFYAFAVCSDRQVGRNSEDMDKHDLSIPATTDTASLIAGIKQLNKLKKMTVVFSTYQSIDVVSEAQKNGLPDFDIIICDEAHRTTGVTQDGGDDSHFVKVHGNEFIKSKKRLYMTATPRIFSDAARTKADEADAILYSMEDESLYGPEFHRLGFGKAVSENLLTDYKVLVLAVHESVIDPKFQRKFANEDQELPLEDVAKIIGCWNGLSKKFGKDAPGEDSVPMKRAVGFARAIKDSKAIAAAFRSVVEEYQKRDPANADSVLDCELAHVDGTYNVLERNKKLDWLKADMPDNTCRILTNARCLSEGVDVPALDAVLFLNPRDSMVDVVQSVGRIMRKSEGKKYGYVILPVAIPAGVPPEEALKDNKKYKVVWQVLQALRAHDDRFDAEINKIDLNKKQSDIIQVIGVGGGSSTEGVGSGRDENAQLDLTFPEIEDWKDAIYAKIVVKCGNRPYWENWAADVAKIAENHTDHLKALLKSDDPKPKAAFDSYLNSIRMNINPSISEDEAVEMLSQHLITKPVFDALFEHYRFTESNPVSKSMQSILNLLDGDSFRNDSAKLKSFYDSVKMRVRGINNPEGRQRVIVELYDRFFKIAFPKMSERLGIVYTPIEVVDFILKSVDAILSDEFGRILSDENIHILDPFTGTGTFLVRLLQSGLIKPEDLRRKFKDELHANEIVLLAYYIAAINIEETYHGIVGGEYTPFDGVVLTDTFQLNEREEQGTFEAVLPENSERVQKQKSATINVIVSNPPYSAQQDSGNDNNQNINYPVLDQKIEQTYVVGSSAKNSKNQYDSYIRAIRWSTDRIAGDGIVGFVTNGSFIEANNMDGLRKSLTQDFSKIYCLNLRGDRRIQGRGPLKEGGQIFGAGCRTTVAITFFVKNASHSGECQIYYHDIGDYLSREEKLARVQSLQSIKNIAWKVLVPNEEGDWINQRNPEFNLFFAMGSKDNLEESSIFSTYSLGVVTNRDPWAYSFSADSLTENMDRLITSFNNETTRFAEVVKSLPKREWPEVEDVVQADPKLISWSRGLRKGVKQLRLREFEAEKIVVSSYRPFTKQKLYFDPKFNEYIFLIPKLFPTPKHKNIIISVIGVVGRKGFSVLAANEIPNLHYLDTSQCFPLYYFDKVEVGTMRQLGDDHEASVESGYVRRDAITDIALTKFRDTYGDLSVTKEDIFFYIYGLLHANDYRVRYLNDLKKMLPRIPFAKDFWRFSKAGRELAHWHLDYETVSPYEVVEEIKEGAPNDPHKLYKVNEAGMRFGRANKKEDRSTIIFNSHVTLRGIPLDAYQYVVNGKPAIESVMERYLITADTESTNINDANSWSTDPRYIVDLLKRVIRVSMETNRIVASLPPLELIEEYESTGT